MDIIEASDFDMKSMLLQTVAIVGARFLTRNQYCYRLLLLMMKKMHKMNISIRNIIDDPRFDKIIVTSK